MTSFLSAYGVTPAGFVLPSVQVILSAWTGDLLSLIDPTTDVSPDQPLGQHIGIGAKKLGELWQLGQALYNNTNRANAEDDQLDNIGSLSGTLREPETPSTVACTLQFTQVGPVAGGIYPHGSLVAYPPGLGTMQFTNTYDITVPPTVGGMPIGTGNKYSVTTLFQSLVQGPTAGDALIAAELPPNAQPQLTQMVPVTGWFSVLDLGAISVGALTETDPPYRVRQYEDLSAPGNNTIDATEAAVLEALQNAPIPVQGASCVMYENTTLAFDPSTGLAAKTAMVVVYDGFSPNLTQNNPLIAQAIWNNHDATVQTVGNVQTTAIDSQGNQRIIYFTRPTALPLYLNMTVAVGPTIYASTTLKAALAAAITTALVNAGQGQPFTLYGSTFAPGNGATTTLVPGQDVIAQAFASIVQGQSGVVDVPAATFLLGFAYPAVAAANLLVPITQVATLNSGNDGSAHPFITITFALFDPTTGTP